MPRDALVLRVDDAHLEGGIGVFVVPVWAGIVVGVWLYFSGWGVSGWARV